MTRRTITPAMTDRPPRKKETPRLMWEIILRQIAEGHIVHVGSLSNGRQSYRLACPGCGNAIDILDKRQREHVIPLALGGPDDATNQQYWHERCSKKKTNGESHDVSNGDIHKIAKTKRLQKAHEAFERGEKKAAKMNGKGAKIPKRQDAWGKEYKERGWNEADEERLIDLWENKGRTASEIARLMNRTRNAVLGKVNRMGLIRAPRRTAPITLGDCRVR